MKKKDRQKPENKYCENFIELQFNYKNNEHQRTK